MTERSRAHRAGFTVRCACGNEYHSDDAHIGRRIRCRCGRTVVIERPAGASTGADHHDRASSGRADGGTAGRRRRRSRSHGSWSTRFRQWRQRGARAWGEATTRWLTLALHDFVHPRRSRRWATRTTWLLFALLLTTWLLFVTVSEDFLPTTLLLYGPRTVILVPILLLLPWVLLSARRALFPLIMSAWIAMVPLMGMRVSPTTLGDSPTTAAEPGTFRVLSFNVFVGTRLGARLHDLLETYRPDVVAFQECSNMLWDVIQKLDGWYSKRSDALCTFSRWPMTAVDSMRRPAWNERRRGPLGGYGSYALYRVDSPDGPLHVANLHLPTARYGLQALMRGDDGFMPADPLDAIGTAARTAAGALSDEVDQQIASNRLARAVASERASLRASASDPTIPLVIAGDFNLPVESTIYRTHWSHFTNAFEEAGNGVGWTKHEGSLRIRIDHVLMNGLLEPRRAVVGDDWYSDHLPVVVDVRRRGEHGG